MPRFPFFSDSEDGHSLVESVIAVALLVTVLGPISGAMVYALTTSTTANRTSALLYARSAIEHAPDAVAVTDSSWTSENGRWTVHVRARPVQTSAQASTSSQPPEPTLVLLHVSVHRGDDAAPTVEFTTLRPRAPDSPTASSAWPRRSRTASPVTLQ